VKGERRGREQGAAREDRGRREGASLGEVRQCWEGGEADAAAGEKKGRAGIRVRFGGGEGEAWFI
jgi:hypothetical protein